MSTVISRYPDQNDEEEFIGNCTLDEWPRWWSRHIHSARIGTVAFDINGRQLPENYRPIYIHRNDIEKHSKLMDDWTFKGVKP